VKRWFAVLLLFCANTVCAELPLQITFDGDEVGKVPSGWISENQENMAKVYSVQADGKGRFLHADANSLSVLISSVMKWDIKDYPILYWRWRAIIFPTGSNERMKSGDDSVLGLYVVFSGRPFVTAIKYVWSDTLPPNMAFDSPYSSGTKIIVVRSGRALAGSWVTEERNLLSDYEHWVGKGEKRVVAQAIAILTDSDNTHSRAVGDYAEISITPSK
jgi:hypothetical protein